MFFWDESAEDVNPNVMSIKVMVDGEPVTELTKPLTIVQPLDYDEDENITELGGKWQLDCV